MTVINKQLSEMRLEIQKFIKLFGVLEQRTTPCGYPLSISQVLAMQELEKGTLSIVELSNLLFLERSTVSRLVDSLVKEGFVQRSINNQNRREVILSMTDKGIRSIRQVKEQSLEFYKTLLGDYTEDVQLEILQSIKKLTYSLSKVRGEFIDQE